MKKIEQRLIDLLKERGFIPTLHEANNHLADWSITFRDGTGVINVITRSTNVEELWWLMEELGDRAPKTPFEAWLAELDRHFIAKYGMSHTDFEDYDWWGEFESEVSPFEAFTEWKLHVQGSELGG